MNLSDINLPLVSVGIPTYNRPEGLHQTLKCITNQTYTNLEIIVSDNGSDNPEVERVVKQFQRQDPRIRYFKQEENKGGEFNFKFVLNQSSGKYFMWAADDDLHEKAFVNSLVSCFLDDESVIFAGSFFDTINFITGTIIRADNVPLLTKENTKFENFCRLLEIPTPSFIYGIFLCSLLKQSHFIQQNAFDYGDVFFLCEVALLGKMCVVPQVLYHAGETEAVRLPKSSAKFRLPGFKYGYSTYYFETVKLILGTKALSWNEKLQALQMINTQVHTLVLYHEKEHIGVPVKYLLNVSLWIMNKMLRSFRYIIRD